MNGFNKVIISIVVVLFLVGCKEQDVNTQLPLEEDNVAVNVEVDPLSEPVVKKEEMKKNEDKDNVEIDEEDEEQLIDKKIVQQSIPQDPNLLHKGFAVEDENYIYFSNLHEKENIYRRDKETEEIIVISKKHGKYFNLRDDKLYFVDKSWNVNKLDVITGEVTLLTDQRADFLYVDNNLLYYTTNEGLFCEDLEGNNQQILIEGWINHPNFYNLKIYYLMDQKVYRYDLLDGSNELIYEEKPVYEMQVYNESIYYKSELVNNNNVYQASLDFKTINALPIWGRKILIKNNYFYFEEDDAAYPSFCKLSLEDMQIKERIRNTLSPVFYDDGVFYNVMVDEVLINHHIKNDIYYSFDFTKQTFKVIPEDNYKDVCASEEMEKKLFSDQFDLNNVAYIDSINDWYYYYSFEDNNYYAQKDNQIKILASTERYQCTYITSEYFYYVDNDNYLHRIDLRVYEDLVLEQLDIYQAFQSKILWIDEEKIYFYNTGDSVHTGIKLILYDRHNKKYRKIEYFKIYSMDLPIYNNGKLLIKDTYWTKVVGTFNSNGDYKLLDEMDVQYSDKYSQGVLTYLVTSDDELIRGFRHITTGQHTLQTEFFNDMNFNSFETYLYNNFDVLDISWNSKNIVRYTLNLNEPEEHIGLSYYEIADRNNFRVGGYEEFNVFEPKQPVLSEDIEDIKLHDDLYLEEGIVLDDGKTVLYFLNYPEERPDYEIMLLYDNNEKKYIYTENSFLTYKKRFDYSYGGGILCVQENIYDYEGNMLGSVLKSDDEEFVDCIVSPNGEQILFALSSKEEGKQDGYLTFKLYNLNEDTIVSYGIDYLVPLDCCCSCYWPIDMEVEWLSQEEVTFIKRDIYGDTPDKSYVFNFNTEILEEVKK